MLGLDALSTRVLAEDMRVGVERECGRMAEFGG